MSQDAIVLNEEQRRAVEWNGGPLLVLAGPGAGKTEVLAERAIRVIRETPRRRFRVLGLTFTNLAAGEMKQRVTLRLGRESERVRLLTFHSFCAGVLRQHGSHIGLKPDFRILTLAADRARILAKALGSRAPWGRQPMPADGIARNLDELFRRNPAAFDSESSGGSAGNDWGPWLLRPYVSQLIEENCQDYGSLLFCCLRLARSRSWLREDLRIAYRHVLVDEYQDTNAAQDLLLRELWPPGSSDLFVVADDDQTVFQWNGANPERIATLRDDYQMETLHLPETYRCAPEVVRRANRLLASGPSGPLDKGPMIARESSGAAAESVRSLSFGTETQELEWITADLRERGLRPGECAVLARTGRLVEAAFEALRAADVPAWRRQPRDEFVSPAIRYLLAALRLAGAPRDEAQLRLLARALEEITGASVPVDDVEARAEVENGALLAAFAAETPADSDLAMRLVESLRRDLVARTDHRRFARRTLEVLEPEVKAIPDEAVQNEARDEMEVWRSLASRIRQQGGDAMSLRQFLHELDLRPIVAEPKPDEVRCLTIHQAKGKGFPHVYLVGVVEDLLPSWHATRRGENGPGIQEERRNCFVAITRASKTLTLTWARSYFGWPKRPSRFLREMDLLPQQ